MALPDKFTTARLNEGYLRTVPTRYATPMAPALKCELEELGLFNLQMTAATERDVQNATAMVRFTVKAMLAALSPMPKDYPAKHDPGMPPPSRHMPVVLSPAQLNMAPEGYIWVFYTITASSSASYDHAAVELKMLTEMYIATKKLHQPRPTA